MPTVYKVLLILHSEVTPVLVQGRVKNVHATTRRSEDHRSSKCQRGGWGVGVGDKRAKGLLQTRSTCTTWPRLRHTQLSFIAAGRFSSVNSQNAQRLL